MNILLVHQHFNTPESGGPIRSWYLATALVRKGHRVSIITSCTHRKGYTATLEGIEVVYLPIPYNNRFSFTARSWSFIRFALGAILAASRFRHYDLCYAISVPLTVGLCARWLKWRYGIPYWFEVGDLWPDAPVRLGYLKNPLVKTLLYRFERSVYRSALGVVALSVPIREAILQKVSDVRVELIPNMADCDFYADAAPSQETIHRYGATDQQVISYLGAMGVANGLHHLLDCAAASLRHSLPLKFILCGDGAMLDELKARCSRESLSNVLFAGFLNREGVREVLNLSNAVFVSYLPEPILETGCPNKYFDGLAAGKVIIINFGGWIRKEIEANNCGLYIDPRQPDTLVSKFGEVMNSEPLQNKMRASARRLAEERYSRKQLSEEFVRLFETN